MTKTTPAEPAPSGKDTNKGTKTPTADRPTGSPGEDPPSRRTGSVWRFLSRIFRRPRNGQTTVRDALEELIEEHRDTEAPVHSEERVLLENVLGLAGRTVGEVMVPRADIVALDVRTSVADAIRLMIAAGHSRVPIYRGTLDNATGMVHIKDLVTVGKGPPSKNKNRPKPKLSQLAREILFVSPSMRVTELMLEMRTSRRHMALVVDEHGGVDGLVTIEDLVEEVVGEIEDEHESLQQADLVDKGGGVYEVAARVTLQEFNEALGEEMIDVDEDSPDTLGGLVFALAGRVPIRGELISHPQSGLEFEILDADPRRIRRLRVRKSANGVPEVSSPA